MRGGDCRKLILTAIAAGLIAVAGYGVATSLRDSRPLPERSSLIVKGAHWLPIPAAWLSPNRLFYIKPAFEPRKPLLIVDKDETKGKERVIGEIGSHGSSSSILDYARAVPSPDGGYRVGFGWRGAGYTFKIFRGFDWKRPVRSIHVADAKHPVDLSFAWHRDTISWSTLESRRGSWTLKTFPIDSSTPSDVHDLRFLAPKWYYKLTLIGYSNAGHPVIARTGIRGWDSPFLEDFVEVTDLRRKRVQVYPFKRPEGVGWSEDEINDCSPSPLGDRLLWVFSECQIPRSAPRWLERMFPFLKRKSSKITAELWLSDANGTNMRPLGWVPASRSDPWGGLGSSAEWLPGGRHVAFTYKRDLYKLRVPPG